MNVSSYSKLLCSFGGFHNARRISEILLGGDLCIAEIRVATIASAGGGEKSYEVNKSGTCSPVLCDRVRGESCRGGLPYGCRPRQQELIIARFTTEATEPQILGRLRCRRTLLANVTVLRLRPYRRKWRSDLNSGFIEVSDLLFGESGCS